LVTLARFRDLMEKVEEVSFEQISVLCSFYRFLACFSFYRTLQVYEIPKEKQKIIYGMRNVSFKDREQDIGTALRVDDKTKLKETVYIGIDGNDDIWMSPNRVEFSNVGNRPYDVPDAPGSLDLIL
jgi:hypothetical protein